MTTKTLSDVQGELFGLLLPELRKCLALQAAELRLGEITTSTWERTEDFQIRQYGKTSHEITITSEDGIETRVAMNVDIREERREGARWGVREGTGRWYASVGAYGEKRRFICGKNGWTKLDEMATILVESHMRAVRRQRDVWQQAANSDGPRQLKERLNVAYMPHQVSATASTDPTRPVKLSIERLSLTCTVEDAEKAIRGLAALGLIRL